MNEPLSDAEYYKLSRESFGKDINNVLHGNWVEEPEAPNATELQLLHLNTVPDNWIPRTLVSFGTPATVGPLWLDPPPASHAGPAPAPECLCCDQPIPPGQVTGGSFALITQNPANDGPIALCASCYLCQPCLNGPCLTGFNSVDGSGTYNSMTPVIRQHCCVGC